MSTFLNFSPYCKTYKPTLPYVINSLDSKAWYDFRSTYFPGSGFCSDRAFVIIIEHNFIPNVMRPFHSIFRSYHSVPLVLRIQKWPFTTREKSDSLILTRLYFIIRQLPSSRLKLCLLLRVIAVFGFLSPYFFLDY